MTDANTFPHPILITGGAGFLGSHMMALCLEKKVRVVVIDNLSNSDLSNLQTLEKHFNVTIPFFNIDIRDKNRLKQFFKEHQFSAVIHFAGLKSVSESVANPDLYFENNVTGSQNLIGFIKEFDAILLDLWLSDSTAEESLEAIAGQAFRGQIVLISGLDNEALEDACEKGRRLGLRVNGFLRKPVDVESLKALLADLEY